ncbi:hypothetical protein [Streptosporangium sp. NPDC048865]|uniref:hypothetical protein n=1 Tax=Streptosporangium sp. NPDC048865 TaxID=3155766 RepID=UPI00342FD637
MIYFDGKTKDGVLAAAGQRLDRSGWSVSRGEPPGIRAESAGRLFALVAVERFEGAHVSGDLRERVTATGMPMDDMAYVSVLP